MLRKIALAASILALLAAAFIFISAFNLEHGIITPRETSPSGTPEAGTAADKDKAASESEKSMESQEPAAGQSQSQISDASPSGGGSSVSPALVKDIPLDKIDVKSAKKAYDKATSLASRAPELSDIKKLVPVLLKFTPGELSTLTRLASRHMTKEEIEQVKSILLAKLNQEDIELLLQLGPKYGLDFRAVLGVTGANSRTPEGT